MTRGRPKLADDVKTVSVTMPATLIARIKTHARTGFFGAEVGLSAATRDLIEAGLERVERRR